MAVTEPKSKGLEETTRGIYTTEEDRAAMEPEPQPDAMEPAAEAGGAAGLGDSCFLLRRTRVRVQLDEGLHVCVALGETDAAGVLELTQRLRERRERERAALPPVYNFGGESQWFGSEG